MTIYRLPRDKFPAHGFEVELREHVRWNHSEIYRLNASLRRIKDFPEKVHFSEAALVIGRSNSVAIFLWDDLSQAWWSCYVNTGAKEHHLDEGSELLSREEVIASYMFWKNIGERELGHIFDELVLQMPCPCEACALDRDPEGWLKEIWVSTRWSDWPWLIESQDRQFIPTVF